MTFSFSLHTSSGKTLGLAELSGRIDALNKSELQTSFDLWLKQTSFLIFDCSKLDFIDSSGLGALVSCLRKAIEQNGDVKLAHLSSKVSMVFELTKAHKLFSIFADTESAIQSF